MSNSFYNHGSIPVFRSQGLSSLIRAEFDAITAGFNKLPALSAGVGRRLVAVNAAGDGLETIFNGYYGAGDNSNNVAYGLSALAANAALTAGNSAFGVQTLAQAVTSPSNTAIGYRTMYNMGKPVSAGSFVVGFQYTILVPGTTNFVAIGAANNNAGTSFIATGAGSGTGTATSNNGNNTAVGASTLFSCVSGYDNAAFGSSALYSSTGYANSAFGTAALYANAVGNNNVAVGYYALGAHLGDEAVAIGTYALMANTTGVGNAAGGFEALKTNVGANFCTAFGYKALRLSNAASNTAFGSYALTSNAAGASNTAVGHASLYNCLGDGNSGLGQGALVDLSTGDNNTAIGAAAGINVTTGSNNTSVGASAYPNGNFTNATSIGYGAHATQSNQIVMGDSDVTQVKTLVGVAIPAGGTTGVGLLVSSTANFGVFFGSGAPTLSAGKGSLYLRSDGTTTNNRAYVNTDGGTTWTALTTAA